MEQSTLALRIAKARAKRILSQNERRQGRQGLQRPVWHDWQVRTLLRMLKIHTKTGLWASNFDDLDPDTLLGCPTGRRKEPNEAN